MRAFVMLLSFWLAGGAAAEERLVIKNAMPACSEAAMISYINAQRSGHRELMAALIDEGSDDPPCIVLVPGEQVMVSPANPRAAIVAIERQDGSVWTMTSPAAETPGEPLPPALAAKYREWKSGPVRLNAARQAFGVGTRMVARDELAVACRMPGHAADLVELMGAPDAYNAVRASYENAQDCKPMRVGAEAVVVEDDLTSFIVRVRLLPAGPEAWVDVLTAYGASGARERAAKRDANASRAQR